MTVDLFQRYGTYSYSFSIFWNSNEFQRGSAILQLLITDCNQGLMSYLNQRRDLVSRQEATTKSRAKCVGGILLHFYCTDSAKQQTLLLSHQNQTAVQLWLPVESWQQTVSHSWLFAAASVPVHPCRSRQPVRLSPPTLRTNVTHTDWSMTRARHWGKRALSSAFMSVLAVVSVGSDPLSVRTLCRGHSWTLAEFLWAFIKFGISSAGWDHMCYLIWSGPSTWCRG